MYNLLNQTYITTTVLKFSTNMPIYVFKKNVTSHSYTNHVIAVHCTNIQTKLTALFAVKIKQLNTVNSQTTTARELVMFQEPRKSLRN
jgi:ribosomal protein L23